MIDFRTLSDEDLAGLLKSGNDMVFKEIYERYNKLLFLYAFKKLRDEEAAKDVVQDVFLWLLRNRETLILKTTLSGYLYKSVLNKVFDIFKHKDIILEYIGRADLSIDVDSTGTDYLIREKEIAAIIEHEIAAMPPRMREIYELKRKSYLSTKQIAEQLGISEHTVSTQLKNAMKHLKVKLGVVLYVLYMMNS